MTEVFLNCQSFPSLQSETQSQKKERKNLNKIADQCKTVLTSLWTPPARTGICHDHYCSCWSFLRQQELSLSPLST